MGSAPRHCRSSKPAGADTHSADLFPSCRRAGTAAEWPDFLVPNIRVATPEELLTPINRLIRARN